MTDETRYNILRIWSEALYDHQDVRTRSLNRVRSLIRRKLLDIGYTREEKKEEERESQKEYKDEKLLELLKKANEEGKLTDSDRDFLENAFELGNSESSVEKSYEMKLKPLIEEEPIWNEWLKYVNGISTRNTSRLLKYFGYCERFESVSKLWAYSGLSVKDGKSMKRKKGEKLSYNIRIKSGVVGVVAKNLILANGKYKTQEYDTYKKRILERGCCNNEKCKGKPGHAANMANRAMVKIFLSHYWAMTRKLKGLPTRSPYAHREDDFYSRPYFDKNPNQV